MQGPWCGKSFACQAYYSKVGYHRGAAYYSLIRRRTPIIEHNNNNSKAIFNQTAVALVRAIVLLPFSTANLPREPHCHTYHRALSISCAGTRRRPLADQPAVPPNTILLLPAATALQPNDIPPEMHPQGKDMRFFRRNVLALLDVRGLRCIPCIRPCAVLNIAAAQEAYTHSTRYHKHRC